MKTNTWKSFHRNKKRTTKNKKNKTKNAHTSRTQTKNTPHTHTFPAHTTHTHHTHPPTHTQTHHTQWAQFPVCGSLCFVVNQETHAQRRRELISMNGWKCCAHADAALLWPWKVGQWLAHTKCVATQRLCQMKLFNFCALQRRVYNGATCQQHCEIASWRKFGVHTTLRCDAGCCKKKDATRPMCQLPKTLAQRSLHVHVVYKRRETVIRVFPVTEPGGLLFRFDKSLPGHGLSVMSTPRWRTQWEYSQ